MLPCSSADCWLVGLLDTITVSVQVLKEFDPRLAKLRIEKDDQQWNKL